MIGLLSNFLRMAPADSNLTANVPVSAVLKDWNLLHHYLFSLRVDSALGVLGGDRNYIFALRQRRSVVAERSVAADYRHLFAIDHHLGAGIGLALYFDYMPMLHQGIKLQS